RTRLSQLRCDRDGTGASASRRVTAQYWHYYDSAEHNSEPVRSAEHAAAGQQCAGKSEQRFADSINDAGHKLGSGEYVADSVDGAAGERDCGCAEPSAGRKHDSGIHEPDAERQSEYGAAGDGYERGDCGEDSAGDL